MIHVVYKGRALPRAWRVRQARKGHFAADLLIALVELISGLIPAGARVVFLGDGEFDGTRLPAPPTPAGWSYACRTATSTVSDVGGRDLPPGCTRRVSQAGQADRVKGCPL